MHLAGRKRSGPAGASLSGGEPTARGVSLRPARGASRHRATHFRLGVLQARRSAGAGARAPSGRDPWGRAAVSQRSILGAGQRPPPKTKQPEQSSGRSVFIRGEGGSDLARKGRADLIVFRDGRGRSCAGPRRGRSQIRRSTNASGLGTRQLESTRSCAPSCGRLCIPLRLHGIPPVRPCACALALPQACGQCNTIAVLVRTTPAQTGLLEPAKQ